MIGIIISKKRKKYNYIINKITQVEHHVYNINNRLHYWIPYTKCFKIRSQHEYIQIKFY